MSNLLETDEHWEQIHREVEKFDRLWRKFKAELQTTSRDAQMAQWKALFKGNRDNMNKFGNRLDFHLNAIAFCNEVPDESSGTSSGTEGECDTDEVTKDDCNTDVGHDKEDRRDEDDVRAAQSTYVPMKTLLKLEASGFRLTAQGAQGESVVQQQVLLPKNAQVEPDNSDTEVSLKTLLRRKSASKFEQQQKGIQLQVLRNAEDAQGVQDEADCSDTEEVEEVRPGPGAQSRYALLKTLLRSCIASKVDPQQNSTQVENAQAAQTGHVSINTILERIRST